jgi:tRNA threonylcarbamoyladenosine biosynthesis protein TsaB
MDARRNQVYNARFSPRAGDLVRLTPDRAISLADLVEELKGTSATQLVVGDGAKLCYDALIAAGIPARLAPPNLRQQSAWGVAREALALAQTNQLTTPGELVPVYHRLSQAERERLAREQAASPEIN